MREITFHLGFVVVTIRSGKTISEPERKTFVLLGCEKSRKYRKYKLDVKPSIYNIRKCVCPFKLRGKPYFNGGE